jgi:hypothetical protein
MACEAVCTEWCSWMFDRILQVPEIAQVVASGVGIMLGLLLSRQVLSDGEHTSLLPRAASGMQQSRPAFKAGPVN